MSTGLYPCRCNILQQHTATHCNTLQHTAPNALGTAHSVVTLVMWACSTVHSTVSHCNTLQHTATQYFVMRPHLHRPGSLSLQQTGIELNYTIRYTVFNARTHEFDGKNPPPRGVFSINYLPSSRTVCKSTPLEAPSTNSSRGVLLHTVLDEGT